MLRIHRCEGDRLVARTLPGADGSDLGPGEGPLWLDLLNPTPEEDACVERALGISLPSREEMQEIEMSARLYNEGGAEFMTITAIVKLDSDEPMTTPITFVLKGANLATVRFAEPRAFRSIVARAQRPNAVACSTGEQVMLSLIEALIDRMADTLERVAADIDAISRSVFRHKSRNGRPSKSRDLAATIEQIGSNGDLLTKLRESLVSINRLLSYHSAAEAEDKRVLKEVRARIKSLHRDAVALSDQSNFLSNKTNFLLDATLGLINLEQNQIIKIFSIVAVVLMPPTLVASIYGMNFAHMPELGWTYGYPTALVLMAVAAVVPYLWFKREGWL
ncbi:MAG TPA: magnesium/cobalt transporter CorA [Hyphomicrobiaceae bacterium]|jgi:magnesium transporter|nr:magnesium/cobalt transporter CorA [Hyphomicrobiaceae bacterium]